MKIKEAILKVMSQEKVNHLFMVPGGLVDPFLTAFSGCPEVVPIVAAQEGGAAYMADGYARASRKFGVCLCIGGPGAGNTTTPLLAAKSDGSPLLVISGEVPTDLEGLGMFQDASLAGLDDFDILKKATKLSMIIENPKLFRHHFEHSLKTLLSRPRAPVHLCVPKDIQDMEFSNTAIPPLDRSFYGTEILDIKAAQECLGDFRFAKMAILAGDGVENEEGAKALLKLSESLNIPVATTLKAKGVFPENHPLSLGVFGYAGTRQATQAFLKEELEVLIVLGSGLNQRDSMNWTSQLRPSQRFIQVNVDLADSITSYPHTHLIQGDAGSFVNYVLSQNLAIPSSRKSWVEKIMKIPRYYAIENLTSSARPIHPARVVGELRTAAPKDTILLVDSGAHRAFCGHYWQAFGPGEYISATNLGPMGWAIPAAIGVKLAQPQKPCCVVTGDGCMLMHGMEIQTAARYKIPIVYVVINNSALGNVFLRAEKEGQIPMELTSLPDHDWASFAKSLGAAGETVKDPEMLKQAFDRAFDSQLTYVIDIKCDKHFTTPVEDFEESQKTWSYHD